jgi:hypothetical protein
MTLTPIRCQSNLVPIPYANLELHGFFGVLRLPLDYFGAGFFGCFRNARKYAATSGGTAVKRTA